MCRGWVAKWPTEPNVGSLEGVAHLVTATVETIHVSTLALLALALCGRLQIICSI